jgi:hypothetical protein
MRPRSRVVAALIAIAFLLQHAEGMAGCAGHDHAQVTAAAAMAPHPAGHHSPAPGNTPRPRSCGPIDGAPCLTMSGCAPTGAPAIVTRFFTSAAASAVPTAALVDTPALRDIAPESPPPRA